MSGERASESVDVTVDAGEVQLAGMLTVPADAKGLVIFAHGSGSSRFSPRNRFVAEQLNQAGLATLLFDLLTADENVIDEQTRELRFDIPLLARRLAAAVVWAHDQPRLAKLNIGLFGASTGAAAALIAAAQQPGLVKAVVSRGGRPDLAGGALRGVASPVLLIVGGHDTQVIELNREAAAKLTSDTTLEIVPGASHLFEERGTLEAVAALACEWLVGVLGGGTTGH